MLDPLSLPDNVLTTQLKMGSPGTELEFAL